MYFSPHHNYHHYFSRSGINIFVISRRKCCEWAVNTQTKKHKKCRNQQHFTTFTIFIHFEGYQHLQPQNKKVKVVKVLKWIWWCWHKNAGLSLFVASFPLLSTKPSFKRTEEQCSMTRHGKIVRVWKPKSDIFCWLPRWCIVQCKQSNMTYPVT